MGDFATGADADRYGGMSDPTPDPMDELVFSDELDCPCCRANEAVAPFVAWLRETREPAIEALLLAQATAITALEQLGAADMAVAPWARLRIQALVDETRARCFPEPTLGAVRSIVTHLLAFLMLHRLLAPRDKQRLRRQVRLVRARS